MKLWSKLFTKRFSPNYQIQLPVPKDKSLREQNKGLTFFRYFFENKFIKDFREKILDSHFIVLKISFN